jgi:hypothetical protein
MSPPSRTSPSTAVLTPLIPLLAEEVVDAHGPYFEMLRASGLPWLLENVDAAQYESPGVWIRWIPCPALANAHAAKAGVRRCGSRSAARLAGKAIPMLIPDAALRAIDSGPRFKFTEAISFVVKCDTQEEIDDLWKKLSAGGEKGRCGWP